MEAASSSAPSNLTDTFRLSWTEEDADWWLGAEEEDSLNISSISSISSPSSSYSSGLLSPTFGSGGIFASAFLPPPPRPSFLEVPGSASCDLCGWAWQEGGEEGLEGDSDARGDLLLVLDNDSGSIPKTNGSFVEDASNEFGLVLALVIVSIVSAVIGAIIMVTFIKCRNRLKHIRSRGVCSLCRRADGTPDDARVAAADVHNGSESDKGEPNLRATAVTNLALQTNSSSPLPTHTTSRGVWAWLTMRRKRFRSGDSSPNVERHPHCTPENHYTLSSTVRVPPSTLAGVSIITEEALYAELDHGNESETRRSQSPKYEDPSYQNMGYQSSETDPDGPISCRLSASSPIGSSSAYYSDLSMSTHAPNGCWEATYEAIDAEPNLPLDVRNAITVITSDLGRDLSTIHEIEHDAIELTCRREGIVPEQVICNVSHHQCSLPVTKTVPSDYV